ncbi:uncharacterized protein SRS1_15812 [Sporisorium reilianum f. sp. reilianum]|uniref:Uncharacterized protein n=1 Tax=Sporisorium reilianum f. sp. reilianum TaxID=72559 RepID=A0A2N8UJ61_9BASI|nr:uncharacterized protein SRS1_15812 [Sporisorium reilianum f. sp. reilianum]
MSDTTAPPPSASTAPTIAPLTSANLRVAALSHLIHGATPSTSTTPALPRLSCILSTLSALSGESANKPIARLLDDWDAYADLLAPLAEAQGARQVWDAHQQASYVLSLHAELHDALHALGAVETLVDQRKVLDPASSRSLARSVETNAPRLASAQQRDAEALQAASAHNARLTDIVARWSNYTSTLSQAFTLLDEQVWALERHVAALERAQAAS